MYLLGGKIKPFQGCSYNILVLISDLPNCPVITVLYQPLFLFACRRVVIIYHSLPANVASFPGSAHALEPGNEATANPIYTSILHGLQSIFVVICHFQKTTKALESSLAVMLVVNTQHASASYQSHPTSKISLVM